MKASVLAVALFWVFPLCRQGGINTIRLEGAAQGTTYHITYLSAEKINFQREVDSLLKGIDLSLSTYVPHSLISRINRNETDTAKDPYFSEVFRKAQEVSRKTGGLFDATVAPVVNAWGFGFSKKAQVDSRMIDSLLQLVDYRMVRLEDGRLVKEKRQIMLDFNALAQGYTVDLLASFLESKGIGDYLVELGGEVRAKGVKSGNESWKVGIDQPNEAYTEGRPLKAVVCLSNKALATSGNYRKFYVEKGRRYAHIIDPRTGYPAQHNLLSATVVADDCMTADAYATAFMVMGMEKARQFLSENKDLNLEVFFIYDENGTWKTYASESMKKWIEEVS